MPWSWHIKRVGTVTTIKDMGVGHHLPIAVKQTPAHALGVVNLPTHLLKGSKSAPLGMKNAENVERLGIQLLSVVGAPEATETPAPDHQQTLCISAQKMMNLSACQCRLHIPAFFSPLWLHPYVFHHANLSRWMASLTLGLTYALLALSSFHPLVCR